LFGGSASCILEAEPPPCVAPHSLMADKITFLQPAPIRRDLPLFIFLPGMDGTGVSLRSQVPFLQTAFDIRTLYLPPDDRTGWEELTTRTLELIAAELTDPPRSIYLCGESFGSCLALRVALKKPEWIQHLTLINCASAFVRRPLLSWGSLGLGWLPDPLYRASGVVFLPFLAALGRITRDDRQNLLAAMQSVPLPVLSWRLSLLRTFHVATDRLREFDRPVSIVASAADRLLPSVAEAQRLLVHLPHARKVILPRSGHACLLETDVNLYDIFQTANIFAPETVVGTSE